MAKKREVEKEIHYKKIISKQKSIIKELKKRADRSGKMEDRLEDLELELISQIEEEEEGNYAQEDPSRCPKCSKGSIEIIDLKVRKILVCSKCEYRQIKK